MSGMEGWWVVVVISLGDVVMLSHDLQPWLAKVKTPQQQLVPGASRGRHGAADILRTAHGWSRSDKETFHDTDMGKAKEPKEVVMAMRHAMCT